MKPAYEQIGDLVLLTQHQNQRYNTYLSAKVVSKLNSLLRDVRDIIRVGYSVEETTKVAETALKKKVNKKLKTGLDSINSFIQKEMSGFIGDRQSFYKDQLDAVFEGVQKYVKVKSVSKKSITSSYNDDYMTFEKSGTHNISSMWITFTGRLALTINQAITQAYILEKSEEDFEGEVYGSTASTNISKGHLRSVVGAYIAHAFSSVLKTTNKGNSLIFSGYIYQAVMDSKTTEICASLNGKYWIYEYPLKSSLPYEVYPGLHYNCRSYISGITKSYLELGIDPSSLTGDQMQLLATPAIVVFSYSEFIASQSAQVQKEILGPTRYSMYKSGEIIIDRFYTKDGRMLTLSELTRKGYEVSSEYLKYVRK